MFRPGVRDDFVAISRSHSDSVTLVLTTTPGTLKLVFMSAFTPQCQKCLIDCVFVRAAPFGSPQSYGVEWRCPRCNANAIDVCPVGPIVPTAQSCLNCGNVYNEPSEDALCNACGLTRLGAHESFGLEPIPPDAATSVERLMKSGLIRRAIAIANLTLVADPKNTEAWRVKYSFLCSLGMNELALVVLDAFIAHSNDPELRMSRGYTLQTLNRHSEAVDTYRKYLHDVPHGPASDIAWCNLANSLYELKDERGAELAYRQAISGNTKRATHYGNFFRLLYTQKRYDEAHAIVDQGRSCADDPALVRRLLEDKSLLFAEQMIGAEALRYADLAVERGSDGVRVHYLRGRALALLGRLDEARREILRVLQLDARNADGLRALAMIDSARAG